MVRGSTQAIAAMIVRVGAVYLAVQAVIGLTQGVFYIASGTTAMMIGSLLSIAVLAALLWVFSDAIARATLSRSTAAIDSDIDERGWLRIGLFLLGAFLLASGLAKLGIVVGMLVQPAPESSLGSWFAALGDRGYSEYVIPGAFHVVVGIVLMLGAHGIVRLFTSTRHWLASPPGDEPRAAAPPDPP